jgi:hypothetical protein
MCRPVLLAGKRHRWGQLNLVVPGELLFFTDTNSGMKFLADTGAAYSVIPHAGQTAAANQPRLKGAGGQGITCYGEWRLTVCFSGCQFQWTFLLPAVESPLLGADFLKHFKLLVNLSEHCLMDAETLPPIGNSGPGSGGLLAVLQPTPPKLRALIS